MKINPYLMFNGNCEAAFKFYQQCLGGEITMMMPHREAPSAEQGSPEWQDKIMHACLDLGDRLLMGADSPPECFAAAQGFYVQISVPEAAEAERIFHRLAETGEVKMPIARTFWSVRFGMLIDQFGTPWMINCDQVT